MSDIAQNLPINWGLVKNPLNWIIIILMVLIAGFAFGVVSRAFISSEGKS